METKIKDFGYADRRESTRLTPTEIKMNEKKKKLIGESLRYPIIDIVTFMGYKGDSVIKITTLDEDATVGIETIARHLGFEVNTLIDSLMVRKIHCATKNNVYKLKVG